jgi:hypothetical protein
MPKVNGKQVTWNNIGLWAWRLGVALVLVVIWLMGRIETPETKELRINTAVEAHAAIDGHPVIVERVDGLKEDLSEVKKDVKVIRQIVSRMEAAGGG